MKKYIKPDIKTAVAEEEVMAALSLHDKVGQEQLGNETTLGFEEEETNQPQHANVWD